LETALTEHPAVVVLRCRTKQRALEWSTTAEIDLVIVAESVQDISGLAMAAELVAKNPLVNIALVSRLDGDIFHERSEGLGILMQLPEDPGPPAARALLDRLETVLALTSAACS
jgi:DNA-binding response OmpR family regulator